MPKLTLTFKGRLIDVFHLNEGQTLIGRDDECQITIDSLAIAPIHASVTLDEDGCRIGGMDEEFPVHLNHNETESAALQHGDVVQLGKHTLTFSEDAIELAGELKQKPSQYEIEAEESEEDLPAAKGMLQIMNGDNFGRVIPLSRNMTRIGRVGGDCAMIAKRDSGYYISHLEGAKSPMVNKQPIGDESLLLNDGDVVEVGTTQMQFHT